MEQISGESRQDFVKRRKSALEKDMATSLEKIKTMGDEVRSSVADSRKQLKEEQNAVQKALRENAKNVEEITGLHKKLLDI